MKIKQLNILIVVLLLSAQFSFSQIREKITVNGIDLDLPPRYLTEVVEMDDKSNYLRYVYFMDLARESLLKKEYHKTLYYLQYTRNLDSPEYWFYLGITVLHEGSEDACKKYLKKGFMDLGCWECGEAHEKLFGEKLKFMNKLENDFKID
ncbi:hypothetical protein [Corallibacter sp.]|uniref:hypothetical protein n=1 Tax=Corallibacter sp. TaxID=2038084 RepID=UPI003AB2033D